MTIIEAMKARKSVRSFSTEPMSADDKQQIEAAIASAASPFGGNYTIMLKDFPLQGEFKPGTYGVIKNASSFLLMAIGEDTPSILGAGYAMERVVLRATELGLGTCWIAATFKGSDFERDITWPEGQALRIVSPIGIPADRQSLLEKITRFAVKSANRKTFGRLFSDVKFGVELPLDSTFGESLQMMRLAPSSTNSQPWRALVRDNEVHFYRASDKQVAILDMGIGLCHFDLAEKERGHGGAFYTDPHAPVPPDKWLYVISYKRD